MTNLRNWLLVLVVSLLSGCAEPDYRDHLGNGYTVADLNADWLIINYWATWCAPCIREIPELNEFNHRADVQIVGVDFDAAEGEALQQAVRKMKIEFPVLTVDPHKRFGYERPMVLPTTIVISPTGQISATLVGPQTSETLNAAMQGG